MDAPRPTRPFLRRGEGLKRFRMTPDDVWIDPAKNKSMNQSFSSTNALRRTRTPPKPDTKKDSSKKSSNLMAPQGQQAFFPQVSSGVIKESVVKTVENEAVDQKSTKTTSDNKSPQRSSVRFRLPPVPKIDDLHAKTIEYYKQSTRLQNEVVQYEKLINMGLKNLKFGSERSDQVTVDVMGKPSTSVASKVQDVVEEISCAVSESNLEETGNCTDCCNHTDHTDNLTMEPSRDENTCDFDAVNNNEITSHTEPEIECPISLNKQTLLKAFNELTLAQRNFERERKEFEMKMEKDRVNFQNLQRDERMKLQKEKMVFEKYTKSRNDQPSRKDRETINKLETEVTALNKQLKEEKIKSAALIARLRGTIRTLETDLIQMKKQNDELKKQNDQWKAHNERLSKRNETKVLHQVNRLLSKELKESVNTKIDKENDRNRNIKNRSVHESVYEMSDESSDDQRRLSKDNRQKKSKTSLKEREPINFASNLDGTTGLLNKYEDIMNKPASLPSFRNVTCFNQKSDRDGSKIEYSKDGSLIETSACGQVIKYTFANGSTKTINYNEGVTHEFDAVTKVNRKLYDDGSKIFEYADGTVEKIHKNEVIETVKSDGTVVIQNPHNEEEFIKVTHPSGVRVIKKKNNDETIYRPNGEVEYRTQFYTKVIFPSGDEKTQFPNGSTVTKYKNGRLRKRDENGQVILDTFV